MDKCEKCGKPLVDSDNKHIMLDGDKVAIYIPYYCPYCQHTIYVVYYFSQTRVVKVADLKEIYGLTADDKIDLAEILWREKTLQNTNRQPKNILELIGE